MGEIYIKDKKYEVSYRLERTIKLSNEKAYAEKFLNSKNYKEKKIPEYMIITALLEVDSNLREKWEKILTSEIYGKGLIPNEILLELIETKLSTDWLIIDEKYQKGIIKDEYLNSLFKLIKEKKWNDSNLEKVIDSILMILSSQEYEEGKVSDESIDFLLLNRKNIQFLEYSILKNLLNNQSTSTNRINDEWIKLMFQPKNDIINLIIYYITELNIISEEDKEKYIQTVLNLENKESLEKMHKLYYANDLVVSKHDFAKQFVLYTLLLSQEELNNGYTRKKEK